MALPPTETVRCRLECRSRLKHLSQVLTGFTLLARAGTVRLSQECGPLEAEDERRLLLEAHLTVVVDGRARVVYDMHDSGAVDEPSAEACDLYFKRSYDAARVPGRLARKVLPFGLNYGVYPDGFDRLELARLLRLRDHWKRRVLGAAQLASRALERVAGPLVHAPTVSRLHAAPRPDQPPRVLFMTRAWDPAECSAPAQREERAALNAVRARCVELLRREFGARFTGGLEPTPFALRNFRSAALEDRNAARQDRYLRTLAASPICVATTGLHGSNSWKTAEYVAFSKAIVSEPLRYQVPGGFRAGANYLEFSTPERCVEAAVRLFRDAGLRASVMRANHEYYERHLRPDRLVARTLALAREAAA